MMRTRLGNLKSFVVPLCFLAFVVLPAITTGYLLELVAFFLVYIIIAQSWNILGGFCSPISLGNAAYFGLGAYLTSVLIVSRVNLILSVLVGAIVACLVSLCLIPTFRLKGLYYAIATLFLTFAVQTFVFQLQSGRGASPVIYLTISTSSSVVVFYVLLAVTILTLVLIRVLQRSRFVLAWNSIKADEETAASLGINVLKWKVIGMVIMAFLTGIAGGFYVTFVGLADPADVFGVTWNIYPLFMVVIGGMGTFMGPIIGAIIFVFSDQIFVTFVGVFSLFIFGVLLVAVALFLPGGIVTLWTGGSASSRFNLSRFRRRRNPELDQPQPKDTPLNHEL